MNNPLRARRVSMISEHASAGRWTQAALLIRLLVLVLGLACIALPAHPKPVHELLGLGGLLLAVLSPARAGGGVLVACAIGGWFACYGVHGHPGVVRTAAFAAALYLLHSAIALAAAVPLRSEVTAAAVRRWTLRCARHLGIAAVLALISYPIGVLGDSPWLELAGLVGVVAVIGVLGLLFSRARPDQS